MTDTPTFQLTDEDKKFFTDRGIPEAEWSNIQNKEDLDTLKDKHKDTPVIDTSNSDKDKNPKPDQSDKNNTEKDDNKTKESEGDTYTFGKKDEDKSIENDDWIARKNEYYNSLATEGKIQDYVRDESKPGFAASFKGGSVHYTDMDTVTVAKDSDYNTFDTMLKDPDNKGRPVIFPENASKETATNMYAACIINGNKVQGAIPKELDEQTLANSGLSPEQIQQVKDEFAKLQPQNKKEIDTPSSEKTTKEDIKNALNEEVEMAKLLNGKIAFIGQGDTQMPTVHPTRGTKEDLDKYLALKEKENARKAFLAEQYKTNPELVKEIIQEALNTNAGERKETEIGKDGDKKTILGSKLETDEQKTTNEALRKQQIESLRAKMSPEQTAEQQKKEDQRDLIMAARLGIAPKDAKVEYKGNEVKALEGKELENYKGMLKPETIARLTNKFSKDGR